MSSARSCRQEHEKHPSYTLARSLALSMKVKTTATIGACVHRSWPVGVSSRRQHREEAFVHLLELANQHVDHIFSSKPEVCQALEAVDKGARQATHRTLARSLDESENDCDHRCVRTTESTRWRTSRRQHRWWGRRGFCPPSRKNVSTRTMRKFLTERVHSS